MIYWAGWWWFLQAVQLAAAHDTRQVKGLGGVAVEFDLAAGKSHFVRMRHGEARDLVDPAQEPEQIPARQQQEVNPIRWGDCLVLAVPLAQAMLIVGLRFRCADRFEPFISFLLEVHRLTEKFLADELQ